VTAPFSRIRARLAPRSTPIRVTPSAQAFIKDSHPPAVFDDVGLRLAPSAYINQLRFKSRALSRERRLLTYKASDDCSTGTPGPIVEDTEIFFR
jgi:hypothetical protein